MTKECRLFSCSQQEVESIVSQHAHLFHELFTIAHCHIPKGWLPLLKLALDRAQDCKDKHIVILNLTVSNEDFHIDFASGSSEAKKMFCSTLAEADSYCPCCGALQEMDA